MNGQRSSRCFVYGLVDPCSLMIRYVGLSSTGMRRPNSHKRPSRQGVMSHCSNWIQGLLAKGMTYSIVVLEEVHRDQLPVVERWWIAYGRASGWPLTNMTDGGESAKHVARAKISAALKKREVSFETRTKMKASAEARWKRSEEREEARDRALIQFGSPEAREALAKRFRSMSEEAREAHLTKMRTAAMSADARARSVEKGRATRQSPEYRAKISARQRARMADPAERSKISEATKAAMARPEIRAKMREKALGRKRSPSTQAKITVTLRARRDVLETAHFRGDDDTRRT